jgi:hypothetical protein
VVVVRMAVVVRRIAGVTVIARLRLSSAHGCAPSGL